MIVKKLTGEVAFLLCDRLMKMVVALLISGMLARQLGVNEYGQFQLAFAVVLMFASIGLICGGEIIVPRLINTTPASSNTLMSNAFALRFAAAILAYACMLMYGLVTQRPEVLSVICILGATVLFKEPFGVVVAWAQSRTENKRPAIAALCGALIKLAAVFCFYLIGLKSKDWYACLWLIEAILVASGLIIIFKKKSGKFFFDWSAREITPLIKLGFPFWLALISMYIFLRIDRIFLEKYWGVSELGIYSAVMQISENMTMVASLTAATVAPILIYQHSDSRTLRKNVLKMAVAMASFGTLLAIAVNLAAPLLIKIIFGEKFIAAAPLLGYSMFATILVFLDAALNTFLIGQMNGKKVLIKWSAVMVVGLLVDWYAIPKFGAYGALLGFSAGYLVAVLVGCYWIFLEKGEG